MLCRWCSLGRAGTVRPVFEMSLSATIRNPRQFFIWRYTMKWQTPAASDMRFGFEITMYIANR